MQSANAYKLKIGEKRFSAVFYRSPSIQLLGSQVWTALPLEKSRSPATVNKLSKPRHNSRTKLCIELSLIHNRDNVELYLHCKFQSSPFSVRRKNGVTDRQNNRQRDYSMPRGSAHRGINIHKHNYLPFHKHSKLSTILQT